MTDRSKYFQISIQWDIIVQDVEEAQGARSMDSYLKCMNLLNRYYIYINHLPILDTTPIPTTTSLLEYMKIGSCCENE